MDTIHDYSFHNILVGRVVIRNSRKRLSSLENVYDAYEISPRNIDPHVRLTVGKFEPDCPTDATIVDRRYIVAENYLFFSAGDGVSSWRLEMDGRLGPPVEVRIDQRGGLMDRLTAPRLFPISFGLRHVLEACLSIRGLAALHAVGLKDRAGLGTLMIGPGGVGKTDIAISAIRDFNCRLLGDERVLVGSGYMKSLLTNAAIFDWKRKRLGREWVQDGGRYLAFLRMIGELGRSSPSSYERDRQFAYRTDNSRLDQVILLQREAVQSVTIQNVSRELTIKSIIWDTVLEWMCAHVYMFPAPGRPNLYNAVLACEMSNHSDLFGGHFARIKEILNDSLPEECLVVQVPVTCSDPKRILEAAGVSR